MMRYHDQKQVEEERVYSAYTSIAIVRLKEVKKGTQNRKPHVVLCSQQSQMTEIQKERKSREVKWLKC